MRGKEGMNASLQKCRGLRTIALIWLGLLLTSTVSEAVAQNVGTFTAEITPTTCSVALESGKDELTLGSYDTSKLTDATVIDKPLLVNVEPQALKLTCPGLPSAGLKPALILTGDVSPGQTNESMFRTPGAGDDTTPSLGIRVQLSKKVNVSDWNTIDYINNNESFQLDDITTTVPVRFTMWCKPISGETYGNCKETGKVAARMTFSFEYQ